MMETFIFRFPAVAENIFKELDNKSLKTSGKVGKSWRHFIYNSRNRYMRKIQRHVGKFRHLDPVLHNIQLHNQCWQKVVHKSPYKILKELAKALEQLKPCTTECFSPIKLAVGFGHLKLCQFIISRIGSVITSGGGYTLLHMAAEAGDLDVFKLLFENADVKNPKMKTNGNTPLHEATENGHWQICEFILNNLEDKNPVNKLQRTPLHLAAHYGHQDEYKLLARHVENRYPKDVFGLTPLQLAQKKGHYGILGLMEYIIHNKRQ